LLRANGEDGLGIAICFVVAHRDDIVSGVSEIDVDIGHDGAD
jgi:hypothetical protein